MSTQPIKVLIADTNPRIVDVIRTILKEDSRLQVIGSASEGSEVLYKVKTLNPAVVLTDLVFPDLDGAEMVRVLRAQNPGTAVLVLSPRAVKGDPLLAAAMGAGLYDYIQRPVKPDEVERIGRQILTRVFVAAMSTAKQAGAGAAGAVAAEAPLRFLLVEAARNRTSSVRELVTALNVKIAPTVLVLVRIPPHKMDQFFTEVKTASRGPVIRPGSGDLLMQGRVYLMCNGDSDLAVERGSDGWLSLRPVESSAERPAGAEAPSVRGLAESLGREFGAAVTMLMVGVDSPESLEALTQLKALGGSTAIEDRSQALLDLVARTCPDAGIPDRKLSIADAARLVNQAAATSTPASPTAAKA